jgi:hypothetical protein
LLENLFLDGNQFTGALPSELGALQNNLISLDVSYNEFTGAFEIDTSIMKDLCLGNNMFRGDLPSEIETDYTC